MVYGWKWDHEKTPAEIAKYGRDGCTRWYPGKNFVRTWDSITELDPSLPGFLDHFKDILEHDTDATHKRSHDFMIGLMADDLEKSVGYDANAER
eukprot:15047904-Heterocapsa_arctica.AAC.1